MSINVNKVNEDKYIVIVKKIVEAIIVVILALIIEYFYFDFYKWNFMIPVTYNGGDAFSGIACMKMRMVGDGNRLGWPLYEDTSMYDPIFNGLSRLGANIIDIYVDDFFLAQNIFLFLIPATNVLSAYLVFCNIRIKKWISFLGALTFGFCPYVQMRIFQHQDLAAVECVPIVFMMCFWLLEDERFASPCKAYFKYKKNILLIIFGYMIANNGIVYYPFFSCFILLLTGIFLGFRDKDIKKIGPSIIAISNIVFWLAIGFVPALRGMIAGRTDVATNGAVRDAERAVFYGLDIKSLLLSPHGYGVTSIKEKYLYLLKGEYEQYYSYFGIVGIIGLVALLIFTIKRMSSVVNSYDRVALLNIIVIFLIMLATSGGVGSIVAIFIPFISSYNRASIFILFASVLTMTLLMNEVQNKAHTRKKGRLIVCGLCLILFIYGLYEQKGCYRYINEDLLINNMTRLDQDRRFFNALEEMAGEEAMVYTLPYMKSFENKGIASINDYEMYRGYMNTDTIKWNYGAVVGSDNDLWNKNVSEMEAGMMIEELRAKGFSGIYINAEGYEGEEAIHLYDDIMACLSVEKVLVHENGNIVYIPLY